MVDMFYMIPGLILIGFFSFISLIILMRILRFTFHLIKDVMKKLFILVAVVSLLQSCVAVRVHHHRHHIGCHKK